MQAARTWRARAALLRAGAFLCITIPGCGRGGMGVTEFPEGNVEAAASIELVVWGDPNQPSANAPSTYVYDADMVVEEALIVTTGGAVYRQLGQRVCENCAAGRAINIPGCKSIDIVWRDADAAAPRAVPVLADHETGRLVDLRWTEAAVPECVLGNMLDEGEDGLPIAAIQVGVEMG